MSDMAEGTVKKAIDGQQAVPQNASPSASTLPEVDAQMLLKEQRALLTKFATVMASGGSAEQVIDSDYLQELKDNGIVKLKNANRSEPPRGYQQIGEYYVKANGEALGDELADLEERIQDMDRAEAEAVQRELQDLKGEHQLALELQRIELEREAREKIARIEQDGQAVSQPAAPVSDGWFESVIGVDGVVESVGEASGEPVTISEGAQESYSLRDVDFSDDDR